MQPPDRKLVVGMLAATFGPYVLAVLVLIFALGTGHGNSLLIKAAVALFALGLLSGALLRPAVLVIGGAWSTTPRGARITVITGLVLRAIGAIAVLLIGFR